MLRPLLIIGLGGSGGKTIRSMKQALHRRFASARYEDGIPTAWQFLQIDTTYDGNDFPAPMLPRDEVHLVVPSGSSFQSILQGITNRATLSEQQDLLAGWGIKSSSVAIGAGAGQVRAIGKQVGIANSAAILNALRNSIAKMSNPTAGAELASLAKALGNNPPKTTPQVLIISSLAGGSGAGMFFDVAELLKRATQDEWARDSIAFLYTAEVFNSLGTGGKDVAKNSLGCMNELIASKWVDLTQRSELMFEKLGVGSASKSDQLGFGCKGNFLVGSKNKTGVDISIGADGAGMDEVFLTIGEALAGALVNDNISEFYYNQAFVNVTQQKSAIDLSGLAPQNAANPTFAAAGIGFGQLGLGADRIVDYVADALAREQIKILLWPELSPELLKEGANNQSLVDDKAAEIWPDFLLDSGVDEKGKQNQIIDALEPTEWKSEAQIFARTLVQKSVSSKPIPLQKFVNSVWAEWETDSEEFLRKLKNDLNAKAQVWVPAIQDKLKNQVASELTKNGYAVLINLVERLSEELQRHALPELKREHQDLGNAIAGFNLNKFAERVNSNADGLTAVGVENSAFLNKVMSDFIRVVELQVQSHLFDLAASLVEDMIRFYFEPLKKSLIDARYELQIVQKSLKLPNGSKNPYPMFPAWGSKVVPERYKPRTIERILIDPADYESTYLMYAEKDTSGSQPFTKSVNSSLLGILMNPLKGEPNEQNLVTVSSEWVTSVRDAQSQLGASVAKLALVLHTDMMELTERNKKWLKNDKSSFGKFTNMSINEFVNASEESPEVRNKREQKFLKEFSAMLSLAQPLALLNESAINYVRGVKEGERADKVMPKTSRIPFAPDSNIGKQCTQILLDNSVDVKDGAFEQNWFDSASKTTNMYATTATQASLPAWAFASLTEPILEQAAKSKNDGQLWDQFWEGRRARPLVEAIPFESEMRRSLITGWFIASMFGLTKIETQSVGRTVEIWNSTLQNPNWSKSPDPLISGNPQDNRRDTWVLPQLLVSGGLALASFGKTGDTTHLHIYQLLKFLGREVTTEVNSRDQWDQRGVGDTLPTGNVAQCTYLRDWIETGTTPAPNLPLHKTLEANLSATSSREEAVMKTFETWQQQYQRVWSEFANTEWHKLPETWELKDDIDLALNDVRNYVKDLHTETAATDA